MDSFYRSTQVRKCTLMVLLRVGVQGDSLGLIRVRIVEVKRADTDTLYSCHERGDRRFSGVGTSAEQTRCRSFDQCQSSSMVQRPGQ